MPDIVLTKGVLLPTDVVSIIRAIKEHRVSTFTIEMARQSKHQHLDVVRAIANWNSVFLPSPEDDAMLMPLIDEAVEFYRGDYDYYCND